MKRREFLKGGVFAASAGLALDACAPESNRLIPILVPEEEFVPGVESWHRSACFECAAGCGIEVRKIDGRLVKVEGNADHPMSRGGLCARGQAAPQAMYHPDRVRGPLVREGARGAGGRFREASWDEVLDALSPILEAAARGDGERLALVTGELDGHRRAIVSRFSRLFPSSRHLVHEPFPLSPIERAHEAATGYPRVFDVAVERAGYVLSLGAELLTAHVSPVRFGRGLSDLRQARPGRRGKLAMASPRLCLTAANADEWIPVRPGADLWLALGIARTILPRAVERPGLDELASVLQRVELDEMARRADLPRSRIERLARELLDHGPSCVVAGGASLRSAHGEALALITSHINALLGAYDEDGLVRAGVSDPPFRPWRELPGAEPSRSALSKALLELGGNEPLADVVLVAGTNPAYDLPPGFGFRRRLEGASAVVSFASVLDETAALADYVVPEPMSFERFEDSVPRGAPVPLATLSSPLLARPLYDTRSMPDSLIALARRMGHEESFPWNSYEDALREAWAGLPLSWSDAKARGGFWDEEAPPRRGFATADMRYRFASGPIASAIAAAEGDGGGLELHVYASPALGDGRSAHLPFLQELRDPITGARWSSVAEIAASDAQTRGIRSGDTVELASEAGTLRVEAFVTEAVVPGVVALAAGQGHESYGRYASGRGANAFALLGAASDEHGMLAAGTRITIRRVEAPA